MIQVLELFSVLMELEFEPLKSKLSFTAVQDGHWFTFIKAVSSVLECKAQVVAFIASRSAVLDLEHIELTDKEWTILESLAPILKVNSLHTLINIRLTQIRH